MGRKSPHQKKSDRRKRDDNSIASTQPSLNTLLSPIKPKIRPITVTKPKNLRPLEDRRTWHPLGPKRPARSVQNATHRLVSRGPGGKPLKSKPSPKALLTHPTAYLSHAVGFHKAKSVLICIRRKIRKEVLFALNRTGKGARARKHRRSEYSSIRC